MTRRAKALDAMVPEALLEMTPADMRALNVKDGERVRVVSRRGEITVKVTASSKPSTGSVFLPFHFKEAAANLLTIDALDPVRQNSRVQVLRRAGRENRPYFGARLSATELRQ